MKGRVFYFTLLLFYLIQVQAKPQEPNPGNHNVLFLNSYSMGYTWADSVSSGVLSVFSKRDDINAFAEFLDAKRFGNSSFPEIFNLFKKKYRNIQFDVALVSDNDALDFMMIYGDSLFPGVPVVICGINNPYDYNFENKPYYGILDGIDMKDEIDMIATVSPGTRKLYFISDSATTTNLLNIRNVKKIEPLYAGRFEFTYLCKYDPEKLIQKVKSLEPGSAIALINYSQDLNGNPVNPENIYLNVVRNSPVPVFMESETLLGKGLAGGIFIKGSIHGSEAAQMALKFVDKKDYLPDERFRKPVNRYYFDYNILRKFNIPGRNLPHGSVVINQPQIILFKYLRMILPLLAIIAFLLAFVMHLLMTMRKRKKTQASLAAANQQVKEMNAELEEVNEHLSFTNEELRRAHLKSEESDRLKSAFLANMSHEIRTPLNAIIGFSSLLGDWNLNPEERENYFRIISSNSNQLLHIIEDILDLSRIEAGQMRILTEVFSLKEVLAELTESFRGQANPGVSIILAKNSGNIMLRTDCARFRQIISNLVSNALKFTRKGYVQVGYDIISENNITFYVRDTGSGISEANLGNIFNRFWKSDEESDSFKSGTGLGLSICKSLAQALGGKIWAESKLHEGSVFYLSLPDFEALPAEIKPDIEGLKTMVSHNWNHLTIAIAEDEISNQYLLTRILRNFQAEVLCFKNGKEIVEFISDNSERKISLILMDLKMPVMDGFTAYKLIRGMNHDIPVIAQTAYAMVEDLERIKNAGFSDYIAKPIRHDVLIEKISNLL
jgi:signal transduction histidine kinase/CheY-like chemotaxis protein